MNKFSIFPHGLSIGQGSFRPALIFKNKTESEILPVWLDAIDASLLIAASQQPRESAHKASLKIFESLNVRLDEIYFHEVNSNNQMATITAIQDKKQVEVKVRASEAISLALNAGVAFFTNNEVIQKSRSMSFDMLLHMTPHASMKGKDLMH